MGHATDSGCRQLGSAPREASAQHTAASRTYRCQRGISRCMAAVTSKRARQAADVQSRAPLHCGEATERGELSWCCPAGVLTVPADAAGPWGPAVAAEDLPSAPGAAGALAVACSPGFCKLDSSACSGEPTQPWCWSPAHVKLSGLAYTTGRSETQAQQNTRLVMLRQWPHLVLEQAQGCWAQHTGRRCC